MSRIARELLICLLALALPAQGALAATLLFCAPLHHAAPYAAAACCDAAHGETRHRMSTLSADQTVADERAENAAAPDAAAPDAVAPELSAPAGAQSCSVCASCCPATAIHDTVPGLAPQEQAAAAFSTLSYAADRFVPDGLDRPPRRSFA